MPPIDPQNIDKSNGDKAPPIAPSQPENIQLNNSANSNITAPLPITGVSENTVQMSNFKVPDDPKEVKIRTMKKSLILGGSSLTALLLVVFLVGYLFLIPSKADSHYNSKIKLAYTTQSTSMLSVYESFGRPIFTENNTSKTSDDSDLNYVNSVIKTANKATSSLSSTNHLTVLPGTTIFPAVNKTSAQYRLMKQYVSDSQNFLNDYQNVSIYMSQFENITDNQLTPVLNNIANANITGNSSLAQIQLVSQNATAGLTGVVTSFSDLNPPPDFKSLQAKIVTGINKMSNDFQGIVNAINSDNYQLLLTSATNLDTDADNLNSVSTSNFVGYLQKDSLIHKEIVKLEAENPLGLNSHITPGITPHNSGNSVST